MKRNSSGSLSKFWSCALHPAGMLGAVLVATAALPERAAALLITPNFETSWTMVGGAPAAATADVKAVINELDSLFTNNVSITVQFGWGDYAAGPGGANGIPVPLTAAGITAYPQNFQAGGVTPQYNLNQTETLIRDHAAANPQNVAINTAALNLPGVYPNLNGSGDFFVSDAEYKALTGVAQNTDAVDGFVGFSNVIPWSFGPGIGPAGSTDFESVVEHEITHAMGRVDIAFTSPIFAGGPSYLTPLDFYKYANIGNGAFGNNLNPTNSPSYFSIDGGRTTPLLPGPFGLAAEFNYGPPDPKTGDPTADTSDWESAPADSFNAGGSNFQLISDTDLIEMNALGWDPAPEPSTWLLLSTGLVGLLGYHWRRRKQSA